jgi:hypothetical protein
MAKAFVLALIAQLGFVNGAPPPADEGKDIDEVEDVVPEDEVLPLDEREEHAGISDAQKDELALTLEEIRARKEYLIALGVGPSKPWQTYSLELTSLLADDVAFGFYAGAGDRHDSGIIDEKAYDLRVKARSAGMVARYYLTRLERLSFEADLGYGTWEAALKPHGSDDLVLDADEKLTSSFRGHGPIFGLGAVLTWMWEGGPFLEWTPVGARFSRTLSKDFTRETPLGRRAILRAIERPAFYGLTNIRFGYIF